MSVAWFAEVLWAGVAVGYAIGGTMGLAEVVVSWMASASKDGSSMGENGGDS